MNRLLLACLALIAWGSAAGRDLVPLNFDWRFALGDPAGAAAPAFADSAWRTLDVPHDWAFEAPVKVDGAQTEKGGYKPGGIGWYRRAFDCPANWTGRHVRVEFDGVYMNSEVWLNGRKLGRRPYGYISFGYDLTPHLQPGRNVLAVRVDNAKEPSARWYHGCGIYAPVRLVVTAALRIAPSGVYVTTTEITNAHATVAVQTEIQNLGGAARTGRLITRLLAPDGHVVATAEAPCAVSGGGETTVAQSFTVANPERWDLATPRLYTAVSEVVDAGRPLDTVHTRFGLREIRWAPTTGFWLNGRNVKLLGVCEHLEAGPVGAAWPDALIRWRIQLLKNMGVNAIRTAHNPQVPRFYELCDELGMLVMDEIFDGWRQKAEQDYGAQAFAEWWERDLRAWLRRDRNHPSIVIYSVGNETQGPVAKDLVRVCHELDPTRPVTSGHSGTEFMDVHGVNGHSERQRFFAEAPPAKPFLATEAPHTWQVRGFYRTQTWWRDGYPNRNQDPFPLDNLTPVEIFTDDWAPAAQKTSAKQVFNSSYDNATVRITARQNWALLRDLPWFSGHFRWTGFDYPGEAGYVHGGWPFRAFMGGAIDLAGFPKDLYYLYQSQWTRAPMVHLLPHWTHPRMTPGTTIPVWAYSNADEVELFLNGRSLGRDRPGRQAADMQCEWLVPWEPGVLEAVAFRAGREVARTAHRTAGAPTSLRVTADPTNLAPDGIDVAQLTVAQVDDAGTPYPYGENRVAFRVEGPVRILSLENGNPVDTEPNFGVTTRRTFYGLTRAFLQATRATGDVSVVVGAINGERRQLTSPRATIDVQRVALHRGPMSAGPRPVFAIHYTLDGSTPTPASTRYTGALTVPLGTTVRALVREHEQTIFLLEESFAADAGHHWLAPGESREISEAGLQAETAVITNGIPARKYVSYAGSGYVDLAPGGAVEWYQENDGGKGQYRLRFRLARAADNTATTLEVFVNGNRVGQMPPPSGTVGQWQTQEVVVSLSGGANRIRVVAGASGGILVDELRVQNQPAAKRGKK